MPAPLLIASTIGGGIVAALATYAGQIALRVLTTVGVGYFIFTGVDTLFATNQSSVTNSIQALPPLAVSIAGALQVGTCIKIVFSAIGIRLALYGINNGVIKRLGVR